MHLSVLSSYIFFVFFLYFNYTSILLLSIFLIIYASTYFYFIRLSIYVPVHVNVHIRPHVCLSVYPYVFIFLFAGLCILWLGMPSTPQEGYANTDHLLECTKGKRLLSAYSYHFTFFSIKYLLSCLDILFVLVRLLTDSNQRKCDIKDKRT